jgi:hypothetical protein
MALTSSGMKVGAKVGEGANVAGTCVGVGVGGLQYQAGSEGLFSGQAGLIVAVAANCVREGVGVRVGGA